MPACAESRACPVRAKRRMLVSRFDRIANLQESRKFTQFLCPKLSEPAWPPDFAVLARIDNNKIISEKARRRLSRLLSAHTDMRFAVHAASLIESVESLDDKYHFFLSMAVCYARPFTENRGLGPITADYPSFPDYEDNEINQAHQRLIAIRHKFLSHSSAPASKFLVLFSGAINPQTGQTVSRPTFAVAKRTFVHPRYVSWLIAAVDTFRLRLEQDINVELDLEIALSGVPAKDPAAPLLPVNDSPPSFRFGPSKRKKVKVRR
jgi:hypothetical protein